MPTLLPVKAPAPSIRQTVPVWIAVVLAWTFLIEMTLHTPPQFDLQPIRADGQVARSAS